MSATTNTFAAFTNSSDANFRIWGSGFAAQLLAMGLVQTPDTGQINWVTVTAPAGTNTFQGYEMWRLNDTLQSTAPVFIKIEYGSGSATNNPTIRFQFGSGSNGTGTLTGSLSTSATATAAASASTVTNYWSGSTGRFMAAAGTSISSSVPLFFGFERSKDANGNDTSEAVLVLYKSAANGGSVNSFSQFAWDTVTGMKSVIENGLGVLLPLQGTGVTGAQKNTYPVFFTKGVLMNPGMNFQVYYHADITALGVVAVPMYGANRNYMPLGTTNSTNLAARSSTADNCLMVRYE